MRNHMSPLSRTLLLAPCAGLALATLDARAALLNSDTTQFAVLGQFSNNQTNFNNGTITGDIGIGTPRQLTFSNCSLVGNVRFSGASNVSGLSGGGIPGPGTPPPDNPLTLLAPENRALPTSEQLLKVS